MRTNKLLRYLLVLTVILIIMAFVGKKAGWFGKEEVIISVPSQNSFARFVKLPPVEKKRIPEIVKFEASQQIPFDINDVQWDWQMLDDSGGQEGGGQAGKIPTWPTSG